MPYQAVAYHLDKPPRRVGILGQQAVHYRKSQAARTASEKDGNAAAEQIAWSTRR